MTCLASGELQHVIRHGVNLSDGPRDQSLGTFDALQRWSPVDFTVQNLETLIGCLAGGES